MRKINRINNVSHTKLVLKLVYLMVLAIPFCIVSCSNDESLPFEQKQAVATKSSILSDAERTEKLNQFAAILSKVVYERQDVREFLKEEALLEFDRSYDILYISAKDKYVGNENFRDILVNYSSEAEISDIEETIPLLNIYISDIPIFNISPQDLDCTDNELPVAVSGKDENRLYFNGECTNHLQKNEIPDFNVLVVNENTRVVVSKSTRSNASTFSFKSPNYDGRIAQTRLNESEVDKIPEDPEWPIDPVWPTDPVKPINPTDPNNPETPTKPEEPTTQIGQGAYTSMIRTATLVTRDVVGDKLIEAYKLFNQDNATNYSMALQRDFLYYGMTPTSEKGTRNWNTTEYLKFIEIDPKCFKVLCNQTPKLEDDKEDLTLDPMIERTTVSHKKSPLSDKEIYDAMWTKGGYNFRVSIFESSSSRPLTIHIPASPSDLWNFNLRITHRHHTMFRHSKYTYTIDPSKFTAKRFYLDDFKSSMGKWDLSSESLSRRINFAEEDESATMTTEYTYETKRLNSAKVGGNFKIGLGDGSSVGMSGEASTSTTTTVSKKITYIKHQKDNELGETKIYFYDPIVVGLSNSKVKLHTYHVGAVKFGIVVK